MKRMQPIFILSMILVIVSLGFTVFMVFFGPDGIDLSNKSIEQIFDSDDWIAVVIIPVSIIIVIASMIPFYRIIFPTQIKNGVETKATVVKVWDTGTTVNDNPQVGLLLDVLTKEGMRFQAETKTIVSRLIVAMVQPGVTANVVYDPNNTRRVQVLNFEVSENGSGGSAENRLSQIADLRDKGLLTEAEYQQKREEIIKAL